MSHHDDDKKNPKKALVKKNRRTQEIFNAFRIMRGENERLRDIDKERAEARSSAPVGEKEEVWSAKVATIRNRLDNSKRSSKERWNRFAGTGGEGGRGL